MYRFLPLLIVVALFATACGDDSAVTTEGPGDGGTRPSIAGDWILVSLAVDGGVVTLPPGDVGMTIELGEINGTLGCNSFFGEIDAADDGTLSIGALGQTEMACMEEGRMAFESTYGRALSSVTAWSIDPAGLTLSGPTVEIVYRPAPPPVHQPLEGTVWHFDTIYEGSGPDRTATNRADMQGVTLTVTGGEALVGSSEDACRTGFTVEAEGGQEGSFTATGDAVLNTHPACGIVEEMMDGIFAASGFTIDENRLTFIGEAGETVGFFADR